MRIGIIVSEFSPPWTEGVRNLALGMVKELTKTKNKIFVVASWHKGLKSFEKMEKIKIYRIPNLIRQIPLLKVVQINSLVRLIKRLDLDIIISYIRNFYPSIGLSLSLASSLTHVPLIHIVHSYPELLFRKQLRWILRFFFQRSTVVTSTKDLKNRLSEIGIASYFIPIGIDTEKYSSKINGEKIRKELDIEAEALVIFFSGGPHTQGIKIFLKALEKVYAKYTDVVVIFNQRDFKIYKEDWDQLSYFKELSKKMGLSTKIKYIGTRDDIVSVYAASDIIILPTLSPLRVLAYPLSLLEAMSMGKALITTKVGSIPEIVEHKRTGILVNPGKLNQLTNAIIELIEDRLQLQKLGENAKHLVQMKFNINTAVVKLLKLVESIICH